MNDIITNNACGNMSGNKTLYLIESSKLNNIEYIDQETKIAHPKQGERFFTIDVYDLEHSSTRDDDYYKNKISANIRSSENLSHILNQLSNNRFVAKIVDNNNKIWLYGTIEEPLRFGYKYVSNSDASQNKQYEIEIEGDTTEHAYITI